MCGIVGYVGQDDAWPIIYEGLKRLEYRGYDSAGIAVVDDTGTLHLRKTVGKVSGLDAAIQRLRAPRLAGPGAHPLGHSRRSRPTTTLIPTPTAAAGWRWYTTASSRTTWN